MEVFVVRILSELQPSHILLPIVVCAVFAVYAVVLWASDGKPIVVTIEQNHSISIVLVKVIEAL